MPSPNYTPILNRAAGTAHVPVLRHPGFVVFDLETFEALQHRSDVLMSPLRLGTDHGRPAIRAKNLQPTEGSSGSHCVADLVMRPGAFQIVAYRDGNPWNLRASNLYTVPRPGMLADTVQGVA